MEHGNVRLMEKRLPKRIFTRIRAEYGVDQLLDKRGLVVNLSAEGLFLTGRLLMRRDLITIRLTPRDHDPIELRGEVRWVKPAPLQLQRYVSHGMGIKLVSPSQSYIDYFRKLAMVFEQRRKPRLEAAFQVRFLHRDEFVKEYTENISAGGLFIATEQTVERDTILDVTMFVPDMAREINIKGRVVYFLSKDESAQFDSRAGIGVQILEMSADDRRLFDEYVRRVLAYYR